MSGSPVRLPPSAGSDRSAPLLLLQRFEFRLRMRCVGSRTNLASNLTIARPDSPEGSLFLRMSSKPAGSAGWEASAHHLQGLDWDRLTAIAVLENAATVLDDRISQIPDSLVPPQNRDRIERLGLIWSFKLKMLERRLEESLQALADAKIDVILLKGAALAVITRGSFADRPMADIDMLVDAEHALAAHELMQRKGWLVDLTGYPDDAWSNHHHLPPLTDKNRSGLRLEIHTAPLPVGHPYKFDFSRVASTAQRLKFGRVQVRVPDIHVYALHSAVHFAWSHRFESGAWNAFRDLAALESTGQFSWKRLIEVARQAGAETCCYWTLRLAQSLAGLPVPTTVLKELVPPINEPFLSLLEEHFSQLVVRSDRACPSVSLRFRLWAYGLQTNWLLNEHVPGWDGQPRTALRRTSLARRLASQVHRTREWSLYLAALLTALAG
jgi:hypothetical protein